MISIIVACRKKVELPSWEVGAVFPLVNTRLTINDLIKDSLLKTETDNSLTLAYKGEAYKLDFDSLFKIPDTTISQFFLYPISGFSINPGFIITNQTQQTKYDLEEVELTRAVIRSGIIEVKLTSYFQGRTLLTYQLPYAVKNGNTLLVTDTLPAATSTTPTEVTKSYDVSGYEFNLKGSSGTGFNTLVSSFKAVALDTTPITSNDSVKIINRMVNIIPEYAEGYFGKSLIEISAQNKAVKKLHNITGGSIDFEKFSIVLKVNNGIGADIQFTLNNVSSTNFASGISKSLTGSMLNSSININRGVKNMNLPYPPVQFSEYTINLNNSNSNADELFEIFPDSLTSNATITLNPIGNISNSNDFVYYGKGINVEVDAEIPLSFMANNLSLADTVEINFQPSDPEKPDQSKNILGGNIILHVNNSFPFSARPQLYLLNENYLVTDSLAEENATIAAADVNSDFYSAGMKYSEIRIPVDHQKIENLKQAKHLLVKLVFSSASQPDYIKIYSDYAVEIKGVADIDYLIVTD